MPEFQLWRQHPNLFLPANQEDLQPKQFYYSGFISEIQRFFWHIVNTLTLNSFGVLKFPIGFALQITWTVKCYEQVLRKSCDVSGCLPPALPRTSKLVVIATKAPTCHGDSGSQAWHFPFTLLLFELPASLSRFYFLSDFIPAVRHTVLLKASLGNETHKTWLD